MGSCSFAMIIGGALIMATGCSGSDDGIDPAPPAGGINGPAVVDPEVLVEPSDDADG